MHYIRVSWGLIQVHHSVVHGRCHLNVSAVMKKAPSDHNVRIVALRHDNDDNGGVAIENFSRFPEVIENNIFASPEFECFATRREVTLKKSSTTGDFGISIVHGQHKGLRRKGIFISDIELKTPASKTNLKVGDMILAVNTESFVGCSLGEATAALATASAAPAPANVLAVSPAEEAAARRVMSLPRPGKKNKRAMAVSREINCDLEDEEQRVQFETIDIRRDEDANNDSGVGVDLVGGCDTAMGVVVVNDVCPSGSADRGGRLLPGDRVTRLNGIEMKGKTNQEAQKVLRTDCGDGKVSSRPRSPLDPPSLPISGTELHSGSASAFEDFTVELERKPGRGLGISVVGRRDGPGVFVSDMVRAGVSGSLERGDQILRVNDVDLSGSRQDEAVAVLKNATGAVSLTLRRHRTFDA